VVDFLLMKKALKFSLRIFFFSLVLFLVSLGYRLLGGKPFGQIENEARADVPAAGGDGCGGGEETGAYIPWDTGCMDGSSCTTGESGGGDGGGGGGGGAGGDGCGSGGDACVRQGSTVLAADGLKRRIEAVVPGDFVLGFDFGAKQIIATPVLEILYHADNHHPVLRKISFADRSVEFTPDHALWTSSGWKSAEDIRIGDTVFLRNESRALIPAMVESVELVKTDDSLLTLKTETDNYFVEGCLVHREYPVFQSDKTFSVRRTVSV